MCLTWLTWNLSFYFHTRLIGTTYTVHVMICPLNVSDTNLLSPVLLQIHCRFGSAFPLSPQTFQG